MGQKVHPIGLRLGINKTWSSRWFADRDYKKYLLSDVRLREFVQKQLSRAGVSHIEIERSTNLVHVIVTVARPGMVIGRAGSGIEELNRKITAVAGSKVKLDVREVENADADAQLIGDSVARQIAKRVNYKRAMKQVIDKAMQAGAKGIKVMIAGRLNGADIARREWAKEGAIPLHTLRSDIDYATTRAKTTYGIIGIKVWVYRGEKSSIAAAQSA